MTGIIASPEYREGNLGIPLIFLAGPVQGTLAWQWDAFDLLRKKTDADIASPRRLGEFQKLDPGERREQREWEHHYLGEAQVGGVILFWLAKETEPIPGREYAQTTRLELGKFIALHAYEGVKIVVGIEPGFPGTSSIRFRIEKDAPDLSIFESLSDTCNRAAELVS